MADVDWVTVWLDVLCEGHYVADINQTTVWPRRILQTTACG